LVTGGVNRDDLDVGTEKKTEGKLNVGITGRKAEVTKEMDHFGCKCGKMEKRTSSKGLGNPVDHKQSGKVFRRPVNAKMDSRVEKKGFDRKNSFKKRGGEEEGPGEKASTRGELSTQKGGRVQAKKKGKGIHESKRSWFREHRVLRDEGMAQGQA